MRELALPLLSCLGLLAPVSSQEVNVALGGTASRSAPSGFGDQPGQAIDGNRDGDWYHFSTIVTANVPGQWWQVTLAAPSVVNEVVVFNRADCCEQRLSNFRVELSLGSTVVLAQDFLTTGGVVERGGMIRMQIPGAGIVADRVRLSGLGINSSGSHFLQFSEVEVIRYGAARQTNVAPHGAASASSNGATASRLIDGSTDGFFGNNRAFQTQNLAGSWVRVDIDRRRIDRIQLWPVSSQQAGCGNFRVSIFDGANEVFGQNLHTLVLMPTNTPTVVNPPAGTIGDSVRVTSLGAAQNGQQRLEFAELEILQFGNQAGENRVHGIGCRGGVWLPPPSHPAPDCPRCPARCVRSRVRICSTAWSTRSRRRASRC
jgi:F5/8 type C domain